MEGNYSNLLAKADAGDRVARRMIRHMVTTTVETRRRSRQLFDASSRPGCCIPPWR